MKKFKIDPTQIVRIIEPIGAATATDMITVDGKDVGYMYRAKPINVHDTGWRFFAGYEDDEYIKNNDNTGFYDLNTIANYDPAIIGYINEPIGSAWERIPNSNMFEKVK